MFGLSEKKIDIPDLGDERLLLTLDTPVCDQAESRFAHAYSTGRLTEEMDLELVCFLSTDKFVREVRFRVSRAYSKLNGDFGAKNGFVYDPSNWLNGFIFHRSRGRSFVGRPLKRVNSHSGLRVLEEAFPDVDPGFMPPDIQRRVEWNASKWLDAERRRF